MKNNRGFTIVELVIVIAVIAVLAAVMIPTFSGIVKKANVSADISTARNMGTILAAEKPIGPREAVDALKANGFERLHPKTKFYKFYWIRNKNIVVLTDAGVRPIFPEEMVNAIFDSNEWFDLTAKYQEPPEDNREEEAPEYINVTFTCNNPDYLKETPQSTIVEYGEAYTTPIEPATNGQYWITAVTIYSGGKQHEVKYAAPGAPCDLSDVALTEDVEINIHVVEYCTITFVGAGDGLKAEGRLASCEKNLGFSFDSEDFEKRILKEGYKVKSIEVKMGGLKIDIFDPKEPEIYLNKVTDNVTVTITTVKTNDSPKPQCRVTYEVNNKDYLDLDQCIFTDTATKGEEFWFTVAPINSNYLITKILLVMNDGENKIERTNRDPIDDKMSFGIPNVTGDIEVSITVEEAFKVTVENADGSTGADTDKIRKVASGLGIAMSHDDLVIEGKKIKSVKVVYTATGEEYNNYSYTDLAGLDIKVIRADLTIIVETE